MAVRRTEVAVIIHMMSTGKCKAAISTARSRMDSVNATMNENIIKVQHGVSFCEFSASRIADIVVVTQFRRILLHSLGSRNHKKPKYEQLRNFKNTPTFHA